MDYVFRRREIAVADIGRIQLANVAAHDNVHIEIDQLVICLENIRKEQAVASGEREPVHMPEIRKHGPTNAFRHVNESDRHIGKLGIPRGKSLYFFVFDARVENYDVKIAARRVRSQRID